jgi:serine/threonine protein kinase
MPDGCFEMDGTGDGMKTIGKYIVRGLLGRGGMSVVYKALLPVVRKTVALKWFCPHPTLIDLWGEETIRARFTNEAVLMGSIRHSHIVEILDFDFMEGRPYFTMEFHPRTLGVLMGEGLRMDAECRRLSLDDTIRYGRQLLNGLGRLHRAGLVHRDIKPHNLLLTDEGLLKISDLGLSKLRGELPAETPRGLVVGSPFYAAPEQIRDPEGVDPRADLYSAAVVIHRMITGRFPQELDERPSLSHPGADEGWDDFLLKAVNKDYRRRFLEAGEMSRALDELDEAWRSKKLALCARPDSMFDREVLFQDGEPRQARSRPVKIVPAAAPHVFSCDSLWRPLRYRRQPPYRWLSPLSIHDEQTGLTWHCTGSEDAMTWQESGPYVNRLNREELAGISDWRLPTVDELFTILDPPWAQQIHCEKPVFDRTRTCLWTSDRCTYVSAWYVDMVSGFAGWADFSAVFFVRVVSGPVRQTTPVHEST